jgi:chromate reductase
MIGLLSGSLRNDSYNTQFLKELEGSIGSEYTYVDITNIPSYNEDIPTPDSVLRLRDQVHDLTALVIATPEYNGSVPGHLKNALDWLSRPHPDNALRGKPIAIYGLSTGIFGAVWAQADLRKVLGIIGAKVVGEGEVHLGQMTPGRKVLDDPEVREFALQRLNALHSAIGLTLA